jgi:hypothetical protein
MKTSLKVLVFLITILFVSCEDEPLEGFDFVAESSSGNSGNGTNATIEGLWKMTAWNVDVPQDLDLNGTASTNLLNEMDCYNNETVTFNSDFTGVSMTTSYADIELNLVSGTTNQFEYSITCVPNVSSTDLIWTLVGNTLATTTAGVINNFTLNGNELSFVIPEGFTVVSDDNSQTIIQDLTIVYTKQ